VSGASCIKIFIIIIIIIKYAAICFHVMGTLSSLTGIATQLNMSARKFKAEA